MCVVSISVYVCTCIDTDVCLSMFVCESMSYLGSKALTGDPICLDLYYSPIFAISSHTAGDCERELLEYVNLFSMSI